MGILSNNLTFPLNTPKQATTWINNADQLAEADSLFKANQSSKEAVEGHLQHQDISVVLTLMVMESPIFMSVVVMAIHHNG